MGKRRRLVAAVFRLTNARRFAFTGGGRDQLSDYFDNLPLSNFSPPTSSFTNSTARSHECWPTGPFRSETRWIRLNCGPVQERFFYTLRVDTSSTVFVPLVFFHPVARAAEHLEVSIGLANGLFLTACFLGLFCLHLFL